jgi:phage repressor protein C with HTH and peptisase S24 domain
MDDIALRLKQARRAAGFRSAKAAAKALSVGESTYRAHENGQNDISLQAAAKYGEFFGVSVAYLAEGTGAPSGSEPPTASVRELVATDGGRPFSRQGCALFGFSISRVWQLPVSFMVEDIGIPSEDAALVAMPGDSMAPAFREGERLLLDLRQDSFTIEGVYAIVEGRNVLVYRFQNIPGQSGEDRLVRLVSDNPSYLPLTVRILDLSIAGRVCGSIGAR